MKRLLILVSVIAFHVLMIIPPTQNVSADTPIDPLVQDVFSKVIALSSQYAVLKPLSKTYAKQLDKYTLYFEHNVTWKLANPSEPASKLNAREAIYGKDGFWFQLHFYQGNYSGAAIFQPIEFGKLKLWFDYGYGEDAQVIEAIARIINEVQLNNMPF
jgi:hypothetical protein